VRRAAVAALLAMACAPNKAEPGAPAPRVVVETSSGARHAVRVEIARTRAEQAKGLMDRTSLDPDAGMLFLFDDNVEHSFWMKNTLIPLDMIFIDDQGTIAGIVERAEPRTLTGRTVGKPSRYVLEVNGGWSAAHGVHVGDRVRFENVPRF
jgi:uncharacterized membrane protein (UPF0127 family)